MNKVLNCVKFTEHEVESRPIKNVHETLAEVTEAQRNDAFTADTYRHPVNSRFVGRRKLHPQGIIGANHLNC